MGYRPTVYCRHCSEPLDVYEPSETRFCSEECAVAEIELLIAAGDMKSAKKIAEHTP